MQLNFDMPTIDGIASGINTTELIEQLMATARAPITQMEVSQATLNLKKSALQTLNTYLTTLQTALNAVDTTDEFGAVTSSSSDPSAIGVTAESGALLGAHTMSVTNVATNTLLEGNDTFATSSASLTTGDSIDITVGSTTTNVVFNSANATETLSGLATYINDNVAGAQAYVLNTGIGANPYKLMVSGTSTGAANAVSVTGDLGFTQRVAAADAVFSIDSVSIQSASNTITTAIPNVTLTLKDATSSPATLSVTRDVSAMQASVQTVVDSYNTIVSFIAQHRGLGGGVLNGDSTLRYIESKLQATLSQSYAQTNIAGLNSVGLGTAQDGTLTFDTGDFIEGLGENYDDVAAMLAGATGLFAELNTDVGVIIDPVDGSVQNRIDSIDTQVADLQDRIEDTEARLESYQSMLQSRFTQMEVLLGKYQATSDYLTQHLAALNASKQR